MFWIPTNGLGAFSEYLLVSEINFRGHENIVNLQGLNCFYYVVRTEAPIKNYSLDFYATLRSFVKFLKK